MALVNELLGLAGENPDTLVCVRWDADERRWRRSGAVWLDPGVGLHFVDVTDPSAPAILASPAHSSQGQRT